MFHKGDSDGGPWAKVTLPTCPIQVAPSEPLGRFRKSRRKGKQTSDATEGEPPQPIHPPQLLCSRTPSVLLSRRQTIRCLHIFAHLFTLLHICHWLSSPIFDKNLPLGLQGMPPRLL